PLCSTERSACAEMRSLYCRPSASLMSDTWQRFGRNRRRVLRFAWLTLLPDITALPVSSQRRDMGSILAIQGLRTAGGSPAASLSPSGFRKFRDGAARAARHAGGHV